MSYSVLDLFAGCGGLSLGLESAGLRTVAANELEAVFCSTFALNHPAAQVIQGSILDPTVFQQVLAAGKGVDVVVGGPPCQGFSTVGKKDEEDPRNRLFHAFLETVEAVRPKIVLFENVSGFKRLYQGRAFDALIEALDRMGYASESRVLNAAAFGAPQIRERTIVVAWSRGFAQPFRFPEETHAPAADLFGRQPFVTMGEALSDLPLVHMGESSASYYTPPQNAFQSFMRDQAGAALSDHEGPNHGTRLMSVLATVPPGGSIQDVPPELRPKGYFLNTYARLWWDRPATTITRNFGTPSSSRCIHPFTNRGLTTREGARLQTFPDHFVFTGSRSEKNLQIGNAVPPLLGRALGQAIQSLLDAQRLHRSSA